MSVRVVFECNGCDRKVDGTDRLRTEFVSFSGREYGFGSRRWVNAPDSVAPEGWVASDPYTGMCYCPECWASIVGEPETTEVKP